MTKRIYTNGCHHVELRENGYCVITTSTGRVQQVYSSLDEAKRWFFGIGL